MNWTEQANAMMNAWAEAQKALWGSGFNLAQTPAAPSLFVEMAESWQKMATGWLESWATDAAPTARDVAGHLFGGQSGLLRLLELLTDAWRKMAPTIESGEDWRAALDSYLADLRQRFMPSLGGGMSMSQDVTDLWQLYLSEMQKVARPWLGFTQEAPAYAGRAMMGDGPALTALANLYWDAYEDTFGALLESPALGANRELEEKLRQTFDLWLDLRRVTSQYQGVMGDIWFKAFERLMQTMLERAEKGEAVESLQGLMRLWTDVADRAFADVFSTEAYIRLQGRMVNTAMAYRLRQREVTETFLKAYDLPTRSEIDQVHRRLYELRKEVKALKKALAAAQTPPETKKPRKRSTRVQKVADRAGKA